MTTYPHRESPQSAILLRPVASPSVLGYFALASALIIYGTWFTGIWGTEKDTASFFPFLIFFGGIGQLAAALWGYRARAAAAAAFHGSWGALWLGVGLIYLLATTHTITVPARGEHWASLGQWMIYMSVISFTTAFAELAGNPVGFVAQAVLGAGAAAAAVGLLMASTGWEQVAGWLFVAAAAFAFYSGAALMLNTIYGRTALPLPGQRPADPVAYSQGDPGVKVGQ
jgi:hypothetical protein